MLPFGSIANRRIGRITAHANGALRVANDLPLSEAMEVGRAGSRAQGEFIARPMRSGGSLKRCPCRLRRSPCGARERNRRPPALRVAV